MLCSGGWYAAEGEGWRAAAGVGRQGNLEAGIKQGPLWPGSLPPSWPLSHPPARCGRAAEPLRQRQHSATCLEPLLPSISNGAGNIHHRALIGRPGPAVSTAPIEFSTRQPAFLVHHNVKTTCSLSLTRHDLSLSKSTPWSSTPKPLLLVSTQGNEEASTRPRVASGLITDVWGVGRCGCGPGVGRWDSICESIG